MQDVWETYMKPVDGRPAAVAFNAEVGDTLPDPELGTLGFVKVTMKSPTVEGLVSDDEADDVGFIEDRLEMEALRYRIGKYIGRVVSSGEVNFIFYLKYDFEWSEVVKIAMGHFPEYGFTSGSRPDPDWEVYRKLLSPTMHEWQMIYNHKTCDRLRAAGDNLRLPRAIEHKAYFETDEARRRFVEAVEKEGFVMQKEVPPSEEVPRYGVYFYRKDVPYYYEIDNLTRHLIDLGGQFGGMYDGWETSLVRI